MSMDFAGSRVRSHNIPVKNIAVHRITHDGVDNEKRDGGLESIFDSIEYYRRSQSGIAIDSDSMNDPSRIRFGVVKLRFPPGKKARND